MCVHTLSKPRLGDYSLGYCDNLIDNCDYVDITEKSIPTNKKTLHHSTQYQRYFRETITINKLPKGDQQTLKRTDNLTPINMAQKRDRN